MKTKILLLLVLIVFLVNPFKGKSQVNVQDSLALVNLYDSTNGPGWVFRAGWLTGPVNSWYGITVDTSGRVTGISLANNYGLTGQIPYTLGNMDSLVNLSLSYNKLNGSIPPSLGNLTNLQSLYLNNNQLSGSIPASLVNLTNLQYLNLNNNELSGSIPASIGSLKNLYQLRLDENQLTGTIPSSLGNLTRLGYLYLNNNQFTGSIPISIENLGGLMELYLNNNQLSGSIPTYIGDLTELDNLNLSSNKLSGNIPSSIGDIPYLSGLSLSQNQLSGSIPSALGNLANLQNIALNNNQLSGDIPPSLGNLTNLQSLYLNSNQLSDSVPASLAGLRNLQSLYLENNHLNGSIPLSIGNLTNLQNLYLDSNYFTFTSLEPIAKIKHPAIIYAPQDTTLPVYSNNNTLYVSAGGTLSNNIYKWYNGSTLEMTITGDSTYTPTTSGKFTATVTNALATSLTLYSDTIALPLYTNIQDSLALVSLYNSANGTNWVNKNDWLEGPVSSWYGITLDNYGRVAGINLVADNLNGNIPVSIGSLANLISLKLDSNHLSGSIPVSSGGLTNLISLTLSDNQLSDTIPAALGNLYKLTQINFANNQLTGIIPPALGNLINLKTLNLNNNRLNNVIPASLASLPKLVGLSLQHNRFTFNGMELIAETYSFATYAPQDTIIQLTYASPQLQAPGYGIGVNWYDGSTFLSTQFYGTPYTVVASGRYSATITDYNAPALTLYSDTVNVSFATNVTDSLALVDLYDSTNGPKWGVDNWLRGPVINWGSVSLDTTGRVISITFLNGPLKGSLPLTLGNLTNLQTLYLVGNRLSGSIPVTLGNLKNLRLLDLSRNSLTDSIPSSLGSLTALQSLNLGYNHLSYNIPPSLGNLSNLTSLTLDNNYLSGNIPQSLGNLTSLQNLSIYGSLLSGSIPAVLGNLSNLQSLSLGSDQLSGSIPPELGNLSNLQSLSLGNDQLSGSIPPELGNLKNLQNLGLAYDQISGNIPSALGNLTNLQSLGLQNNLLSGNLPSELGNLTSLQTLNLGNIAISGSLPSALGNLTNLVYVNITNTHLSGSIPSSFSNLINLQTFSLTNNQFSGSIPSFFNHFDELQTLNLSGNYFSDSIPSLLAAKNFYSINLSHNQLTGNVPANLLSLSTAYFDLSYNKLTGVFPTFLQNNYNLYNFNISHNYYTFRSMVPLLNVRAENLMVLAPQDTILPLHFFNKTLSVSVDNALSENTYKWYRNDTLVATTTGDSTYTPTTYGRYFAEVTNYNIYFLTLYSDTVTIADSLILPARPNTEYASYETTDTAGWTHYYYDNNTANNFTDDTLLLSLKKNGQNIGTIGDGTFAVKLVATAGAGSNTGIHLTSPLITNPTGYWVMNRYWQVTPTNEPAGDVGVRFYYNNQDLKDVNGSYPNHNLTNNNLIFYKAVGGNPDPTTNLAGATAVISILPGTVVSDTTWTYHVLSDTTQYGEYSVASFSGGGGGGTGNNGALPVSLISFTGTLIKNDVQLNWQTAQEINAGYFTVERSLTGAVYTAIGNVNAAGTTAMTQLYRLTDFNAALLTASPLYYRLKITDKDGNISYSGVIKINIRTGVYTTFSVYPNPVQNTATVVFAAAAADKYAIEITDLAGKTVKRLEGVSAAGINSVTVDVHEYAQGAYIITISGDKLSRQSFTLLKQ